MVIRIERAHVAHVAEIAAIEQLAFTDPWSEQAFRDVISRSEMFVACAREVGEGGAGRVLGYVVAWFAGGDGEIANLAVTPDARGRGIGAALLDAAIGEARRAGTTAIYLEVRDSNMRARGLYESRGFIEVGRRRRYYRKPVEDAVILRRMESADIVRATSEV